MRYWLLKSEPDVYSYATLQAEGEGIWDGVRNYQARNNLREMQIGDVALFYHSNIGKEIVGTVIVTAAAFQDPTTDDVRWLAIKVKPLQFFEKTISLKEIKENPELCDMPLVKHSRLSVMPISELHFKTILQLGQSKQEIVND